MHEMSLVQGLFAQLKDLARQNQAEKITRVKMEIGPLSGVVIDSFRFGFEILAAEDQLFRGALLEIVSPEVSYHCSSCSQTMTTAGSKPEACSQCGELLLLPQGGDDIILQQVELE